MRWGDPITTTVRGQGRLLGSKLAWVFQSRRRITIFVLIVAVIASSASYGLVTLNNKNAFRAAEDPEIELPGLDYVEYTTQDIFSQKLALIPPEQLSDYDKIALITELAGANYFRLSTVAERQEFLAAWDTSPEWRQFATQAESGEGGAWQWLAWLGPYCDGGGVARAPGLVPIAQAQSSNACILLLTELQTKKVVKAGDTIGLVDFENDWSKFWQRALNACSSVPGSTTYMECLSTARFSKSYYNSQDLDRIYNTYWKDLKHLRTKKGFGGEEIARLKKIDKYFRLKLQNKMDEAIGELGNQYFNIGLALVPVGRLAQGLTWATKGVGKGVTKVLAGMFDVAAKAPIGTMRQVVIGRGALQAVRVSDRVVTVSSKLAGSIKFNLTNIFAKSTIAVKSWRVQNLTRDFSYASDIFLGDDQFIRALSLRPQYVGRTTLQIRQSMGAFSQEVAYNMKLLSPKEIEKLFEERGWQTCQLTACAHQPENLIVVNDLLYTRNNISGLIGNVSVLVHETGHLQYTWMSGYSSKLGYRPIEEGVVEWNSRYIIAKHAVTGIEGGSAYDKPVAVYQAILDAIRRGQRKGIIKDLTPVEQIHMNVAFGERASYYTYDDYLNPGLTPEIKKLLGADPTRQGGAAIMSYAESLLIEGKFDQVKKAFNLFYR